LKGPHFPQSAVSPCLIWNAAHDTGVVRCIQLLASCVSKLDGYSHARCDSNLVHYICLISAMRPPALRHQLWNVTVCRFLFGLQGKTFKIKYQTFLPFMKLLLLTSFQYVLFLYRTALGDEMQVWSTSSRN